MDTSLSVQNQVRARMQRAKGRVFTPKDFLDIGSRVAVDLAVHRLDKSGLVRRIGRGLYYHPRRNPRLNLDVPPATDDIAAAIARNTGDRIAPSGAVAANRLGLSTQIGANPTYVTDGRTRIVRAGKVVIRFTHVPSKHIPIGRPMSTVVFQALQFIGPDAVNGNVINLLRKRLSPRQRRDLLQDARYANAWMADVARQVAQVVTGSSHGSSRTHAATGPG